MEVVKDVGLMTDGDPATLITASASFPSGPLTIVSFVLVATLMKKPVLPAHIEFVPLVVLRHGLEQYLLTELSHFSILRSSRVPSPSASFIGCLAVLVHRKSVDDGCCMAHHELSSLKCSVLSFA